MIFNVSKKGCKDTKNPTHFSNEQEDFLQKKYVPFLKFFATTFVTLKE